MVIIKMRLGLMWKIQELNVKAEDIKEFIKFKKMLNLNII